MSDKESVLWNTKAGNKKASLVNLYLREDLRGEKAFVVDYDSEYDSLYVGFRTPSFTKSNSWYAEIFYSTNDVRVTGIQLQGCRARVKADPNNENGELFDKELPFSGILNSLDIRDKIREGKSFTQYYSVHEVLQLMG